MAVVSEEHTDNNTAEGARTNPSDAAANDNIIQENDENDDQQEEQTEAFHIDIAPATTILAASAFQNQRSIQTINLPIGLQIIFENAFLGCESLQSIEIPYTVHTIRDRAFYESGLVRLDLVEGLQTLGNLVFAGTPLRLARVPESVQEIGNGTFYRCFRMISVEIPGRSFLPSQTFMHCYSLRNIALLEDSDVGHRGLARCTYLATHFPNENHRLQVLQRRFDGLPVHHLCYYHSYYGSSSKMEWFVSKLEEVVSASSNNGSQSQQDCLGMTPVHILALSTRQILPLYKILIKNCPKDVVTKDKWGDLPLHFVCKVDAPLEIIEFLLEESYKLMDETMDLGIENILKDSNNHFKGETARLLLQYHIQKRLESLTLESWREEVLMELDQVALQDSWSARDDRITAVLQKLKSFEIKESTSLLELAFWKGKMVSSGFWSGEERLDPSIRQQYRMHCCVGIALPNILPFVDEEEDDDSSALEDELM